MNSIGHLHDSDETVVESTAEPAAPPDAAVDHVQVDSPRKRLPIRFSLRTWLIVFSILCVALAIGTEQYKRYLQKLRLVVPTAFDIKTGKNILWVAKLGTQSYGGPVVADGKVYVGTNNAMGYINRYPASMDIGVLLCFDAATGNLLWQASSEKLPTSRRHSWPCQGVTAEPTIEGDRLWIVNNRCELVCLDTEGFADNEDDGQRFDPDVLMESRDADVVWVFDMMKELGVFPPNGSCSRPFVMGDMVYVVTGNTTDEDQQTPAASQAPSFIAVEKDTGKLVWSDASPGANVLDGQWGSPVGGTFGGTRQIIFPGGDGWLYSFDPNGNPDGTSKLLWKFDCNEKTSLWKLGGRGTRNNLLPRPTVHDGLVYVTLGQDPEHGEGPGCVWCVDPTRRGDVSPELVEYIEPESPQRAQRTRVQAADTDRGDRVKANPNSAALWCYRGDDWNEDGEVRAVETMNRCISRVVVRDDCVYTTDTYGLLHCIDRKTGSGNWTYDLFAAAWSAPAASAEHLLVGTEDGKVEIFALSADPEIAFPGGQPVATADLIESVYTEPVIDNNVLYVVTKNRLYAIADPNR